MNKINNIQIFIKTDLNFFIIIYCHLKNKKETLIFLLLTDMVQKFKQEDDIQNITVSIFCLIFCLEIVFFSLAIFFEKKVITQSLFVQFSCCLTFGNIFLLYGIFTKKTSNLTMYFIVYIYTIILTFVDSFRNQGLYLVFKICQFLTTTLRGMVVIIYYRKFANQFISFYFKKYQSDLTSIGKFLF